MRREGASFSCEVVFTEECILRLVATDDTIQAGILKVSASPSRTHKIFAAILLLSYQIVCKRSGNFKRKERSQQHRTFQGLSCAWHPRKTPLKKSKTTPQEKTTTTTTGGSLKQCQSPMAMGPSLFIMVGYMILTWLNFLETFAPGSPGFFTATCYSVLKILQPYHNSTTYHKTLQPRY